jgi:hypothetical protein
MLAGQFYTYFHTRNDTGAVFYVGKGKGRRAYDTTRNKYWRSIYEKCGRTVNFSMTNLSETEAFEHEKYLIAHYKSMGVILANFTNGGEGVSGLVFTKEHRAAIALKSKGRKHSEEYKQLMREKMAGRVMSDEARRKMSASAKARKEREGNVFFSPSVTDAQRAEWIKKSAKSHAGKELSEEHKAKLSAAGKGRVSANKGKTLPQEWREKMSAAGKGRPKSEEHKRKIRAAHIARIERLKEENMQ